MGRKNREQLEEQYASCEEAMCRVRSTYEVWKAMERKYGVALGTVKLWQAEVRRRWRATGVERDRTLTRDEARERLLNLYSMSINRTSVAKAKDGGVQMRQLPDGTEEPVRFANPDLRAALHALRELNHLEGNHQPLKIEHKVEADVSMPQIEEALRAADPKEVAELRARIRMLTDGDPSVLAGADFRLAGGDR